MTHSAYITADKLSSLYTTAQTNFENWLINTINGKLSTLASNGNKTGSFELSIPAEYQRTAFSTNRWVWEFLEDSDFPCEFKDVNDRNFDRVPEPSFAEARISRIKVSVILQMAPLSPPPPAPPLKRKAKDNRFYTEEEFCRKLLKLSKNEWHKLPLF